MRSIATRAAMLLIIIAGASFGDCLTSSLLSGVPPDREYHPRKALAKVGRIPADISEADRMRRKFSTTRGKEIYAQRKCIVEPVYGQLKESKLGFDQFSWRGLKNVQSEFALVCTAHNLLKIYSAMERENSAALTAAA